MSESRISFAISSCCILINLLLFFTVKSTAQNNNNNNNNNNNCASSSSCGKIKISYPFRLSTSPRSCGYDDPSFKVECRNNETIWKVRSTEYIVLDINYASYSMRLVDPTIIKAAYNLSSCPSASSNDLYDAWPSIFTTSSSQMDIPVHFINCRTPVNSSKYVEGPFCGNKSSINSSSQIYSYVMVGDGSTMVSEACTVDRTVFWSSGSGRRGITDTSSLAAIYDDLGYGMEVLWFHALCGNCQNVGYCSLDGSGTQITCDYSCREDIPISRRTFKCKLKYYEVFVFWYGLIAIGVITALKFLIGFPFLVGLVVRKWRRQHLPL